MAQDTAETEVKIEQTVGQATNSLVVGILRNEVHFTVLNGEANPGVWQTFIKENPSPYKFLAPYSEKDHPLFKGRDFETQQAMEGIAQQRLLIVHGEAGVGKTSLFAAGVTPKLVDNQYLVVMVDDYQQPAQAICNAMNQGYQQLEQSRLSLSDNGIAHNYRQLALNLHDTLRPGIEDLTNLAVTVVNTTKRPLFFIFDQFERIFDPPFTDQHREAFAQDLGRALATVQKGLLFVVIVVRTDALEATVRRLGGLRPPLSQLPIEIGPLTHDEARQAIEEPLKELDYPAQYHNPNDKLITRLIMELDELSTTNGIQPSHLQIVCNGLYESAKRRAAREGGHPIIDEELYGANNGAVGILAGYMERTLKDLKDQSTEDYEIAKRILLAIAGPGHGGRGTWVAPVDLGLGEIQPEKLTPIFEYLVKVCMLVRRTINGQPSYGFTSDVVKKSARNLGDEIYVKRLEAGDELERIWEAWLTRVAFASVGSLSYLAKHSLDLAPDPVTPLFLVKIMVLLRSAVTHEEPAGPWLYWFKTTQGSALVKQLEDPKSDSGTQTTPSILAQAERILGSSLSIPTPLATFGPVAYSAAMHPSSHVRQTAALALVATDQERGLAHLRDAFRQIDGAWLRWTRRAELRGTLADNDPAIDKLNSELPTGHRVSVWLWRAWRRLTHDRVLVFALVMGAAIGGGLAQALLHAIIAIPARFETFGIDFGLYFYYGAILSAITALGISLARPLLLRSPVEQITGEPPPWQSQLRTERLLAMVGIITGALAFGIGHLLLQLLTSLVPIKIPLPLVLVSLVAGLGLSASLYALPKVDRRGNRPVIRVDKRFLRLGIAGAGFFLAQWILLFSRGQDSLSLSIVWNGVRYKGEFSPSPDMAALMGSWSRFLVGSSNWYDLLTLLDSTLVGIFMSAGMMTGLVVAVNLWQAWRKLINRSAD